MGQPGSSSQPASSSQPQSSRQPTCYSQPPSSSVASHQPREHHNMLAQANNQLLSVMILQLLEEFNKLEKAGGKGRGREGDDTSTVTRGQQAGRGKGREGASTSTRGNKRPKTVGFGIYTDDLSGRQTLNPDTTGERVVTPVVFKCATPTNIDIGYKPRRLKWKGKDVVTTPQLQRMSKSKGGGSANV
ncbi:hypothetical protein MTR67_027454 [Solanum verrucosum]|uniref:Uncharacterized protein n=1 Tax=Solanum verrucosum TaxID=315347 RepID=A0AAF0R9M8_SOLVR|nr:hypothetical protein MTR67_027454 [Solanum verrucosum]